MATLVTASLGAPTAGAPSANGQPARYPTYYRTIAIDGLSIFYREAGPKDSPTILFLHGLPSSSRVLQSLFDRLADRYDLVTPDYPGFGYTFDRYAENMTRTCGFSHGLDAPATCPGAYRSSCRGAQRRSWSESENSTSVSGSPVRSCERGNQVNFFGSNLLALGENFMPNYKTDTPVEERLTASNPLDAIPDEMPFDVPYGLPISLDRAQAVIDAAVGEAKKRNWKMNVAIADSGGNLVAFQRMDGAMLASIQIAGHKARAAVTFRRPTKVFEDGVNLMHLNYLLAFDGVIASRGGIPLIEQGVIIGAIGCSGGTDSQDEVVSAAGAAVINKLPARTK